MKNDELNAYIKHYIEHDKTNRAIMLTASWGTGKSYYIQNELIDYLKKEENGNHKCIVISLYGINSLSEISKAIYIETKWDNIIEHAPKKIADKLEKAKDTKSETRTTLKTASKTVFKGVTSFLGVDLSADEDNLAKLYESVDLSKYLIILEDLERSGLSVLDVLGYVNNLTEQDAVKILIVANETEILKYELGEADENGQRKKELDKDSIEYLKTKEKTIGDTIYYQCNFRKAIKTIIHLFNNDSLSKFETDECIEDILGIMGLRKCYNLRTFLFACQKSADIFDKTKNDDLDFNKNIFYSIIAFSMMIKNGFVPNWQGNDLVSPDLGISKYPLYRFCYNYIRWQEFSSDEVESTLSAHRKMILFDRHGSNNDPDLNMIYYFFEHTEQEVNVALNKVETRLDDPESIPFYDYRKLAFYLVSCNTVLGYDYSNCKSKMIRNITGKSLDIDEEMLFLPISDFNNEDEKRLYRSFIEELRSALNQSTDQLFSYSPEDLRVFHNQLIQNKESYVKNHRFLSRFDLDRIADMLYRCSPSQLQEFRSIMFSVYRHANSHDFVEEDVIALKSLRDKVSERIANFSDSTDKIALRQYRWIIENSDEFIKNLSR